MSVGPSIGPSIGPFVGPSVRQSVTLSLMSCIIISRKVGKWKSLYNYTLDARMLIRIKEVDVIEAFKTLSLLYRKLK